MGRAQDDGVRHGRAWRTGPGYRQPKRDSPTFKDTVSGHVLPASMIFTDEHTAYKGFDRDYQGHRHVRHKANIYVDGNVHTNTIEGFFSNLKRGIAGTYHAVSRRWLQSYLNEYFWRYNRRDDDRSMFERLLLSAASRP